MSKKKKASNKQTNINVGDISDIKGNMNIAGGNISNVQSVEKVESGSSVFGAFLEVEGDLQVGGTQQYGDTVQNKQEVNTAGGVYVDGPVNTGGGDFVGRDQQKQEDIEHGNKIGGDLYSVNSISNSQGVAVGPGAQATTTTGMSGQEIDHLFVNLLDAVYQESPDKLDSALQEVEMLKEEVAKGNQADDSRIAKLLDGIVELVPGAVGAVVSLFSSPILAGLVGPVTKFVLDKIQGK